MCPLIQCLEVEFDDIAVGIEDVDLRVAGEGVWAEFHLPEVTIGDIVAESLGAEPSQGIAIALHTKCEMNVIGVVRLVAAKRRIRAHYDVYRLLSVADFVPDSRIGESGTFDFLQFQNTAVELSRAFQVVGSNEKMMKVGFVHD